MARSASMICSLGVLLVTLVTSTSCQEHRRLERKTAEAKQKFEELRTEIQKSRDDASYYNKALSDIVKARTPAERQGFTPLGQQTLEDEVDELQTQKTRLEKDLKAIEDEHQQYKKANS